MSDIFSKLILLIEVFYKRDKSIGLTGNEIREIEKQVPTFPKLIDELNLLINTIDLDNICDIGKKLFLMRSELMQCEIEIGRLVNALECIIKSYDNG